MKTALITGASRGIGKATAKKFLDEGWEVIGTSTSGNGWEYEKLLWIKLDLSDSQSIELAVKELLKHDPVRVLINNAGINVDEEDADHVPVSIPALRKTLEVNLIGTIDFTEHMLSSSLIEKDGHIVSLGSRLGSLSDTSSDFAPSYRISKAALSMYTRTLAVRLKEMGITVSIVDPGWVRTDMGGEEAEDSPDKPAKEMFELVDSNVPSGKFWHEGKERSW